MTHGRWPPVHTLDVAGQGLLPPGWFADIVALAVGDDAQTIIDMPATDSTPGWTFGVVTGDVLRERAGWLWALYHATLREFASAATGQPLFPSNRLSATMTLNILNGTGATNDWHCDQNPVSGVFYAEVPQSGGGLLFRNAAGHVFRHQPRSGQFVCFPGGVEHCVEPLPAGARRLAVAMVYHRSITDQPPAYGADRYTLDA